MVKKSLPGKRPAITLDQNIPTPIYKQLYERLRTEILTGQLEADTRLPSTRALANELGVSRNTTALAYEMLLLEGYIKSRVGDGTRVASLQTEQFFSSPTQIRDQPTTSGTRASSELAGEQQALAPERFAQSIEVLLSTSDPAEPFPSNTTPSPGLFRVGQPDVTAFPHEIWARLVAKHARQSLQTVSSYQNAQGYAPLREAIAARIGITRGVHCTPDQIIITTGSQGALDLVARVLLNPGDPVWVEDPGYQGARGALLAARAELIPIPTDREGLVVERGQQLCSQARMAIVTPSHQFPTGVTMSLPRRLALLEWAREAQSWIIEDDYDSEYRFSGRPLEALHGLDRARRVIYIGTFSKTLFPSLRLGYLVVPPALLHGFLVMRHFVDVHLPVLEQLALTGFMNEGHFARYMRKMRGLYLERRNALIEALTQELGDMLEVSVPEAGLHLAAWLPANMSAQVIARQAAAHGLRLSIAVQSTAHQTRREGLLFGFAESTPQELRAGVKRLADALKNS